MKYEIVTSNVKGTEHLKGLVREWMKTGWKPDGAPFNDGYLLCQKMIKEDDK